MMPGLGDLNQGQVKATRSSLVVSVQNDVVGACRAEANEEGGSSDETGSDLPGA